MNTENITARDQLLTLLEPCFAEEPTAGAVILINDASGTHFFVVNMDSEEMVVTLRSGGEFMADAMGIGTNKERTLQ